jgi:hypothetical protein
VLKLKEKAAQAEIVSNGTTERNETGPDETQRDLTQKNGKEPNETGQSAAVQSEYSPNLFEGVMEGAAERSGAELAAGSEESIDDNPNDQF